MEKALIGKSVLGVLIAVTDEMIAYYSPGNVDMVNALGSIGILELRCRIAMIWLAKGFHFPTVIYPTAVISFTNIVERGTQIMVRAVIQTAARIEIYSVVNVCVAIVHDCVVGTHSHTAPGATLSELVEVRERCHVGTWVQTIQAVRIEPRVVVGAGSTVIEAVPDNCIVVGTPAKPISKKTSTNDNASE